MLSSSSIACLSAGLGNKGFFSSANILQIGDVFLLFLLSVSQWFAYFFLTKRVRSSVILYLLPKQLNLVPRSSRSTVQFSGKYAVELTSFFTYRKLLPSLVDSSWL